jgi:hypothetical protein
MPRHQKRIKTTILAHTTTLNLLHDSVHWFIVTIDTTTMTITFQNSAGTYGQHAWKPLLLRWLRQHTPEPWQAVQGTSPRQPRGTECGTHTLLINMIAYTTNKPHPDTYTIQWSHNMRTNADPHTQPHCSRRVNSTSTRHRSFIGSRNHTQPHIYTDNTHTKPAHTQKHSHSNTPRTQPQHMVPIGHVPPDILSTSTLSTHTQHTHTLTPHREHGERANTVDSPAVQPPQETQTTAKSDITVK